MTTTPQAMSERMRNLWGSVDYHPIAVRDVLVSELLARAIDVHSGDRVLDVGSGTGNTALAAARRGGQATATDLVPTMLETASRRASVEGLDLQIKVADAQNLPFEDAGFDVVLSTFGAMYAPDHQRTANELIRVCRPGGRIGVVSWTPTGLVGRLQSAMATVMAAAGKPAPPGPPAVSWGVEQHCRELFGDRVATFSSRRRTDEFCASSAQAQHDLLLNHLPPWRAAYQRLSSDEQEQVAAAAMAELDRANRATDGTFVADAEYLEVIATVA